jgi:hypothetical protein
MDRTELISCSKLMAILRRAFIAFNLIELVVEERESCVCEQCEGIGCLEVRIS